MVLPLTSQNLLPIARPWWPVPASVTRPAAAATPAATRIPVDAASAPASVAAAAAPGFSLPVFLFLFTVASAAANASGIVSAARVPTLRATVVVAYVVDIEPSVAVLASTTAPASALASAPASAR